MGTCLAEELVDLYLAGKVGGAIYDFMGYLTSLPTGIGVGAQFSPNEILDAYHDWQLKYGLGRAEPEIETWST